MSLLPLNDALQSILNLIPALPEEPVKLSNALSRTLAQPVHARGARPPVALSAMDGYALAYHDLPHAPLKIHSHKIFAGDPNPPPLPPKHAMRIFTGAPLPKNADTILIQENAVLNNNSLTPSQPPELHEHVRDAGLDFKHGDLLLSPPRVLSCQDIALLGAADVPSPLVVRRPRVAVLSTGDELVLPGQPVPPGGIVACINDPLCALISSNGGVPHDLGVARDTPESIDAALALAQQHDLLVLSGGVSVGERDLTLSRLVNAGLNPVFHKIAMRPGKPLLFGQFRSSPRFALGLPGNPVSAVVCAHIFLVPLIHAFQNRPPSHNQNPSLPLAQPLPANGPRTHFMRAEILPSPPKLLIYPNQDSSLVSVLAHADALAVRPPNDPPRNIGDPLPYIPLRLSFLQKPLYKSPSSSNSRRVSSSISSSASPRFTSGGASAPAK